MTEEMIFDEWARQVTGISRRRFVGPEEMAEPGPTENMAKQAALRALEAAGIAPTEIDLVVFCTFTPSYLIPNPACILAHLIGAGNVPGIPINTACSGFIDGLGEAYYRIRSGDYRTVLVVASETMSQTVIDFDDPSTAVLFGDGAGAAVLRAGTRGIRAYTSATQYSVDHILLKNGERVRMGGGPNVLKQAVSAMSGAAETVLRRAGVDKDRVKCLIPHQANNRIIQGIAKKLDFPMDRVCVTIDQFGNTSGASLAIALDKIVRGEVSPKIARGDLLLLTAVGGGYTYSGMLLEY